MTDRIDTARERENMDTLDGPRLYNMGLTLLSAIDAERAENERLREAAAAPEARARMAGAKRGRPAHPNTRAALLAAASRPKPPGWGQRANAWMREGKRRDDAD